MLTATSGTDLLDPLNWRKERHPGRLQSSYEKGIYSLIPKPPHQLVEAFKATLEELEYADLLLHVIDISDPHWLEQAQIVDELIEELGAQQIPCLRVYNKSDLYFGDIRPDLSRTGEHQRQDRRGRGMSCLRASTSSSTRARAA